MQREEASAAPAEAETIEELFAALESPLLNYALRLAGELSVAEDIVQEAFMKLHAQFEEVREPRHWSRGRSGRVRLRGERGSGAGQALRRDGRIQQQGRARRTDDGTSGPLAQASEELAVAERHGGLQAVAGLYLGQIHDGVDQVGAPAGCDVTGRGA